MAVILSLMLRGNSRMVWRGVALSVLVLTMGTALLGLSGWFIVATSAAGLAGLGTVFDVFRPSAMIRFLALGRTGARYGERLFTHDLTLSALAQLRVALAERMMDRPIATLGRLRSGRAMNRLMADVDALDGVPLRLALPVFAGGLTLILAALALAFFTTAAIALTVTGGMAAGAAFSAWRAGRTALRPARRADAAGQAFRSRLIDLMAARDDLIVHGQLGAQADRVHLAEIWRNTASCDLHRAERRAGLGLSLTATATATAALILGALAARGGALSASQAAIGFFAALALAETIAPLRRAAAEFGRMALAAQRVHSDMAPAKSMPSLSLPASTATGGSNDHLILDDLTVNTPEAGRTIVQGFSLSLAPGAWVALAGASGLGKSTLLTVAAGLVPPQEGHVTLPHGPRIWLPQRSALIGGTIRDNLALADPDASDDDMTDALKTTELWATLAPRGGLSARLGPRGQGLSGGEARRMALARIILAKPSLAVLDEPTAGLDDVMAARVLAALRRALPPDAIVLVASHRAAELRAADRIIYPGRASAPRVTADRAAPTPRQVSDPAPKGA